MSKILQVLFLTLAGLLAVSAQCPQIVPRAGWSTRDARFIAVLPIRPTPFVIVHPTGTSSCTTQTACSEIIRNIQTFQMDANGWPDISYHFLIGDDNNIYQGRGWGRMGENVEGFNNQAINVGYIGSYTQNPPSAATIELLESLIACGISERALDQNVEVVAQCQVTRMVSCAATTIFDWISEHPRFSENPRPV